MVLQDRIKNNEEYFKCIEVHNGYLTMTVECKPKWSVFPSPDEKVKVGNSPSGIDNEWVYYGKYDEITIDDLFDLVEQAVSVNKEAELKIVLMKEKITELQKIFADTPYEILKTLSFSLKTKNKRQNKNHKKEDNIVEDLSQNEETLVDEEVKTEVMS